MAESRPVKNHSIFNRALAVFIVHFWTPARKKPSNDHQEPPDPQNELLHMPNVIVTPHVASATTRMRPTARRRVGREVSLVLPTGHC